MSSLSNYVAYIDCIVAEAETQPKHPETKIECVAFFYEKRKGREATVKSINAVAWLTPKRSRA